MKIGYSIIVVGVAVLGACTDIIGTDAAAPGFIAELPAAVVAIAAPFQDLQAVRLQKEDGCYWYLHQGPVEATMLPLRTSEGRPICVQQAAPEAA